ncbi:hypothetical protein [Streptomyces exfoliatus]|uniref:hypothetical protein n=1 Tax=Streptomyces exfoliatus TaxID=1905 RepID=UPI003C2F5917
MGVFAVFRRKKKDVATVSPATASEEAGTVAVDGTPVEDGDAASGADAPEDVASTEVTEIKTEDAEDKDETVAAEAVEAAADAVEIPKQQSAEAAADNEAGEGARR